MSGDEGNDVIVSLRSGPLLGGTGNDLILNYIVDPNSSKKTSMEGGAGHDVLIGSSLFLQATKNEEKTSQNTSFSRVFDAGVGDDVIIPYISPKNIQPNIPQVSLKGLPFSHIYPSSEKYIKLIYNSKPSNKIRDTHYQITTGKGKDTIALSSIPAKNVTTRIEDFNWVEDKLAFDSKKMARTVLPELTLLKELSASTVTFNYEGHHYTLSTAPKTQKTINLKMTTTTNGVEIQYPDFGENFDLSYDYALYSSKAVADKLSTISYPKELSQCLTVGGLIDRTVSTIPNHDQLKQPLLNGAFIQKTFSKTYTNDLDKYISVTAKQNLNLTPNKKGEFKVQSSNTAAAFQSRDLFVHQDTQTCVYQNSKTNKGLYFKTAGQKIPENVVAVVVVQENNNGLVFTTQSKTPTLPSSKTGKMVQTFTALDFFTKGHFAKIGDTQNQSVTMRLGLVLKGEKENQLITTPLGNKIQIKVRK